MREFTEDEKNRIYWAIVQSVEDFIDEDRYNKRMANQTQNIFDKLWGN